MNIFTTKNIHHFARNFSQKFLVLCIFTCFFALTGTALAVEKNSGNSSLLQYKFLEQGEEISGNAPISREKFLRWTLNNAGFSSKKFSGGREPFIDIRRNSKNFPYVASAYESGALERFSDSKKFLARKKISRIEAIEILFAIEGISTFQKYKKKSVSKNIKDLPLNTQDKALIIAAKKLGYLSKNNNNLIFPYARLTENDAIVMLEKISKKHKKILQTTTKSPSSNLEKTQKIILSNYLKKSEISGEELEDEALKGMLESLDDKYSVYMPKKKAETFNTYIKGVSQTESKKNIHTTEYVGIGVSIVKKKENSAFSTESEENKNRGIILTQIFDGPAKKSGLLVGDEITHVDGEEIFDLTTKEIVTKIKGIAGTSVELTIKRGVGKKTQKKNITVVRGKIKLSGNIGGVNTEIKDDITWIKFHAFQSTTAQDFVMSLEKNISEETKGLVIDLRYNSGGLLSASQKILGELLPKNNLAVRLKNSEKERLLTVNGSGKYTEIPLVVIQNEYSASASEIFSGAIQDYERGVIIGKKSFGKGVAQNLYHLSNGGQIKLTTHEFFTPLGNVVHQKGITPDIIVENNDDATLWKVVKRILQ